MILSENRFPLFRIMLSSHRFDSMTPQKPLAWPILGERPNLLRVISLVMAFAGLAAIMGGNGFAASSAKMPGIVMALGGAVGFAVGTVLAKKLPLALPPLSAAAWQIGIGCLPVAVAGLLIEKSDVAALSNLGWILLVYATVIQFCVAYVSWFAALSRLPASVAAIGTMAVPVIGVVTAAVALHERSAPARSPRCSSRSPAGCWRRAPGQQTRRPAHSNA